MVEEVVKATFSSEEEGKRMLKAVMLTAIISFELCLAKESASILPIDLPDSYESERLKRLEIAVGFSAYDFLYDFPRNSMLEVTFATFYKGFPTEESTYSYIITPASESAGGSGKIAIFSTRHPNDKNDNWTQWQFWITKSTGGNNGLAAGIPREAFKRLSGGEAPIGDGEIVFSRAILAVNAPGAIVWKSAIPNSNSKEIWRYELHARLVPYDKNFKFNSIVRKGEQIQR